MHVNSINLNVAFKGFKTVVNTAFDAVERHKDKIAMTVESQSSEEDYGWLGDFPELREWIAERHISSLRDHGFKIKNKKFESTIRVKRDDLSDDKLGLYRPMFSEMGRIAASHADKMVFNLLHEGFSSRCYDGQNFFDAEHPQSDRNGVETAVSNFQEGDGPAWCLIDASREVKPVIWQERESYDFQAVNSDNDHTVFMRDEYLYGIRARVNAGFGLWQLAYGSKEELNEENYAAARAAMTDFRGDTGQVLGVTPTHLVVSPKLEKNARQLLIGSMANSTSNIWQGSAEMIVSPFFS